MTDKMNRKVQSCFETVVNKYLKFRAQIVSFVPFFMVHVVFNIYIKFTNEMKTLNFTTFVQKYKKCENIEHKTLNSVGLLYFILGVI